MLESYQKEQRRIQLFLQLTRKNVIALQNFPLSSEFTQDFRKFCESFDLLEAEFRSGVIDHKVWANGMLSWGNSLAKSSEYI